MHVRCALNRTASDRTGAGNVGGRQFHPLPTAHNLRIKCVQIVHGRCEETTGTIYSVTGTAPVADRVPPRRRSRQAANRSAHVGSSGRSPIRTADMSESRISNANKM